jgi:hypothetical protein
MNYETRSVEMGSVQEKAYRGLCESLLRDKIDLFAPGGTVYLTMLSLFAAGKAERVDENSVSVRQSGASSPAKLIAVHELLGVWNERPIAIITVSQQLLFSVKQLFWRQKMTDKIAYAFGGYQPDHQVHALETFTRGERPILLASTTSIGIGADLNRAETTVFLQRSWSPAENLWVESKLSPKCQVVTYVTAGTVEIHQHLGLERLRQIVTKESLEDFLYGRELKGVK